MPLHPDHHARAGVVRREEGRARLGRLTAWTAAGGAAGVGLFAVLAASSSASKSGAVPPDTNVILQPTSPAVPASPAQVPATVPPTVPTTPPATLAPSDENNQQTVPTFNIPATPTTQQPQLVVPPFDPPSSGRHHRNAAATSGGS